MSSRYSGAGEVPELERAQSAPLRPRIVEPGGDDRPAAASGSGRTLLRLGRERHPVALAEDVPALEGAMSVERADGRSLGSSRSPIITSLHESWSRKRHSSTRSAGFAEYAHGQPASV